MACKDCVIDFNTPPPESLQKNKNVGLVIAGVAGELSNRGQEVQILKAHL